MGAYRTPLIDKLKTDSATFYTFGSPIEDIGLNINERTNKVALSHYVLLNLPGFASGVSGVGTINTDNFDAKLSQEGDKNWVLPKILQNYTLNFETMLRNRTAYDYSATKTVSERVFWKTLQKSGAINFLPYKDGEGNVYYHEDFSDPNKTVIKGFGQITTSSQSSNTYNMNNETYIMIPSSYGQMKYYMKSVTDNNCGINVTYKNDTSNDTFLENHTEPSRTYTDSTGTEYSIDTPYYDSNHVYKNTKNTDCLEFEFDTENIKNYINKETDNNDLERLSYDDLAIKKEYCLNNTYEFNTILVYYTIYDSNGNALSTNLFGIMFLASPKENSEGEIALSFLPSKSVISGETVDTVSNHIIFEGQRTVNSDNYYVGGQPISFYSDNLKVATNYSTLYAKELSFIVGGGIKTISIYNGKDYSELNINDMQQGKSNNDNIKIYPAVAYKDGEIGGTTDNIKKLYKISVTFDSSTDLTNKDLITIIRTSTSAVLEFVNIDFYGVTNIGNGITAYNIPSYIKKKTEAGAFGSEYSFRLNIQTASIYDKNSDITDFSTGMPGVLDDFNGVLSNLKMAVEVLTSNSILQAKIYDDFLATKTLITSALSEIEIIKKEVENLKTQLPLSNEIDEIKKEMQNMQSQIDNLK